jgi:hypothetical protein
VNLHASLLKTLYLTPAHYTALQIQDVLNPEYFVGAYRRNGTQWQTTQWSDAHPGDLEEALETKLMERVPLYCTAIPWESSWQASRWTGHPAEPQTPSA